MRVFLCEKPSQARDIAAELGSPQKGPSEWRTQGGIVTWCIGHLLEAAEPDHYDARFARWNLGDLPCIPKQFVYRPRHGIGDQYRAVKGWLKKASEVVIATDADREGEMIAREVMEEVGYNGPVKRLWLSALDSASIRKALNSLLDGRKTEPLYHAARARSEADWLVGMNCTRAATLTTVRERNSGAVSIGRVQTPTLALVVRRDREIENFKSRDYYELLAQCDPKLELRHAPPPEERIFERAAAETKAKAAQDRGGPVALEKTEEDKRMAPPALFSLSGLTKRASKLWGWSAEHTLEVAQALYERHKATTYPRTDCPYLPEEQMPEAGTICAILTKLPNFSHLANEQLTPRKSVFDTSKITAHHAIIPTQMAPNLGAMSGDERKAYLLIAAHYLASMLPDYRYRSTRYAATFGGLVFEARGTVPTSAGWKRAFTSEDMNENPEDEDGPAERALPDLAAGTAIRCTQVIIESKKTKPPPYYTEGTLVDDMENVARYVTDPAKRARLKETSGIGTQATRASIISTLKKRDFIATKGKKIISTITGRQLITRLEKIAPALADPGETAAWEDLLEDIAQGRRNGPEFVAGIARAVISHVEVFRRSSPPDLLIAAPKPTSPAGPAGITDYGEYFLHPKVRGRLYKQQLGHTFTADEIAALVDGGTLTLTDCKSKSGTTLPPKKVTFNAKKKPYPGLEFEDANEGGGGGLDAKVTPPAKSRSRLF